MKSTKKKYHVVIVDRDKFARITYSVPEDYPSFFTTKASSEEEAVKNYINEVLSYQEEAGSPIRCPLDNVDAAMTCIKVIKGEDLKGFNVKEARKYIRDQEAAYFKWQDERDEQENSEYERREYQRLKAKFEKRKA